jgi:hypothetical protein
VHIDDPFWLIYFLVMLFGTSVAGIVAGVYLWICLLARRD